jgi:hypothetical protein
MKPHDAILLRSGTFDRDDWASLWDRLPERARRSAAQVILQELHAIESGGRWKITWEYESNIRRESDDPVFEFDQPGDVITFEGSVHIGTAGAGITDTEPLVGVGCLTVSEWHALKYAVPDAPEFANNYVEFKKQEDRRFADLVRAGRNPCRVNVPAAELLAWCSSNSRPVNTASLDLFAAEKFEAQLARYRNRTKGT